MSTILPEKKLNTQLWHADAPAKVRKSIDPQQHPAAWDAWATWLVKRKKPATLHQRLPDAKAPLLWSLPLEDTPRDQATVELLKSLSRVARGKKAALPETDSIEAWLQETETGETHWRLAIEVLAWANAMPQLASRLEPELWWRMMQRLIALAAEPQETFALGTDPLSYQLLAGELPLLLSHLFPEIKPCRALAGPASETLVLSLDELFGDPHAIKSLHLSILRPLLASYTRCRALTKKAPWPAQADAVFRSLAFNVVRLSRRDGSQALTPGASGEWNSELFAALLNVADARLLNAAAVPSLPPSRGMPKTAARKKLASPALHGEYADVSVLRSEWARDALVLALRHDRANWTGQLDSPRGPIFDGQFECEIRYQDQTLDYLGEWEEVCWVCDEDGQYLEMEIELSGGAKLDRQMFLAADDKFLFWADAVLVPEPGPISYQLRMPLAAQTQAAQNPKHREVYFKLGKRAVPLMPLALGEWRSDLRGGDLSVSDGFVQLNQQGTGRSLYSPWFLDLACRTNRSPITWRQLNVSQERVRTPGDEAVGFRAQLGHKQWMVYRSLTPPINRSVLGVNTTSEFLLSRFKDGDTVNLVEVEGLENK